MKRRRAKLPFPEELILMVEGQMEEQLSPDVVTRLHFVCPAKHLRQGHLMRYEELMERIIEHYHELRGSLPMGDLEAYIAGLVKSRETGTFSQEQRIELMAARAAAKNAALALMAEEPSPTGYNSMTRELEKHLDRHEEVKQPPPGWNGAIRPCMCKACRKARENGEIDLSHIRPA